MRQVTGIVPGVSINLGLDTKAEEDAPTKLMARTNKNINTQPKRP